LPVLILREYLGQFSVASRGGSGVNHKKCLFLTVLILLSAFIFACSSFVVYSDTVMMGMNFDYAMNPDVRFSLQRIGEIRTLTVAFSSGLFYHDFLVMNTAGVFAALQAVPPVVYKGDHDRPTLGMDLLLSMVSRWGDTERIPEIVEDYRIVSPPGFNLHILAADLHGNAYIIDAGERGNELMEIEGNSLVMTNFYMRDLKGDVDLESLPGGWRYREIARRLKENGEILTVQGGIEILQSAWQPGGTVTSVLLFPQKSAAYFVFPENPEKIYELSLRSGSLSSYSGFEKEHEIRVDTRGIIKSTLLRWD